MVESIRGSLVFLSRLRWRKSRRDTEVLPRYVTAVLVDTCWDFLWLGFPQKKLF